MPVGVCRHLCRWTRKVSMLDDVAANTALTGIVFGVDDDDGAVDGSGSPEGRSATLGCFDSVMAGMCRVRGDLYVGEDQDVSTSPVGETEVKADRRPKGRGITGEWCEMMRDATRMPRR
jgi:hypothetical protein